MYTNYITDTLLVRSQRAFVSFTSFLLLSFIFRYIFYYSPPSALIFHHLGVREEQIFTRFPFSIFHFLRPKESTLSLTLVLDQINK